jgi:orotate phosphoribosyltransferase
MRELREAEVLRELKRIGAIRKGHFELRSGLHSDQFIDPTVLYEHKQVLHAFSITFAAWIRKQLQSNVEVLVERSNPLGSLASNVARYIGTKASIVYASNTDDLPFNRVTESLLAGRRVLIIGDILTTGKSAHDLVSHLREYRANVIGLLAICNRGNVRPEQIGDVQYLHALVNHSMPIWEPRYCPFCQGSDEDELEVTITTQLDRLRDSCPDSVDWDKVDSKPGSGVMEFDREEVRSSSNPPE